jgi:PAS domain S-box-containing protein
MRRSDLAIQPKRKMPFLVGALILLLLTIGWLGYSSVYRVAELTENLYNHPFTVSTAVLRIQRDVLGMHRAIKEIVLSVSTEDIGRQQQFLAGAETNVLADFQLVQDRFLGDPALVLAAKQHFDSWKPIRAEVIRLSLAGKHQEALLLAQTEGNQHVAAIEVSVAAVRDFARNKAQEFRVDAIQTRDQTLLFLSLALAITLLLAVLVAAKAIRIEASWQNLNQELELRVQERTNELAVANETLNAQNEEITAMNEELTAQNEEIRAMNEEIDALNQNLLSMNTELEQRVAARTVDLTAAHQEISAQYEEITAQYEELKGMQEMLQHEQVLTDALFNSVPGILYLYDEQGNLLRWNKEHERLTGYSAQELSKMTLFDWYKDDQATIERISHEITKAYDTGFASAEADLQIKGGQRLPMYLTAVPLTLEGKKYFAGIGIDISEQRQMAESLAQNEASLSTLVQTIPDMIWLKNSEGVYLSCNPMFERFFGAKEADIIGKTDYDFVDRELADFFRAHDRKAMEAAEPSVNEEWVTMADSGERVLLETIKTPMLDSKGNLLGVLGIARNITDRKRMEAAVEESEARYRAVMEQAPEAVMICNPDTGEVIEANLRFTERFGYDLHKDSPLKVYQFFDDSVENINLFREKMKQERYLPVQRRTVRHHNGSLVQVERSATLVEYGNRTLVALTIRDVSDEVRREQEIHRDAQLATRVQNALLKEADPSKHIEIETLYHPFSYVGGDLYYMDWRYNGQVLRGFLVDATGHGLGTALHTSSMHVLLREVNELDLPLADQMRWLNQRVGQYFDEGTFAGALAFELDLQVRELRWVCAGIPEIWVATQTVQGIIAKPGMYLGVDDAESFELHVLPIDSGDACYFLTDGLADLMSGKTDIPITDYPAMLSFLRQLAEDKECRDDATAVCLQIKSLPQALACETGWPKVLRFNGYGDYQRLKGEIAEILAGVTGLPHSRQEVAVNEALANALECRDGIPRQHRAEVCFRRVGGRLIVRVKSSRMGFAGNAILRRLRAKPEELFSYGEDAGMGRGIPIMLSISDKMSYNSEGTELLLAWKL